MDYDFKNSKFLVTGGAGFIGSNIVEKILNLKQRVVVLDNFSTGKKENILKFLDNPNFSLIKGDIRNLDVCKKACKGIDYILHNAALGSVERSVKDPLTTNDVNIKGTLNMLIAARDTKVKRFVYASSSSVYGDYIHLPKKEDKLGSPLSPYAITKLVNELYAINFHSLFKLPTIGLRYFNVFGEKQNPNSLYAAVIPIFIKQLLNEKSPTIYGDGEQSRDFTYVGNVVDANLKACLADKKAFGEVFNIALGNKITINELLYKISRILKVKSNPKYAPKRLGDIKESMADISKAEKILNYKPLYDFDEGLKITCTWYSDRL
ncbi:MAG: SDR family oxidoreductase [Firmicutes bacterium]|nr:SDR family oxidoreductase [Bacillota bacterium]